MKFLNNTKRTRFKLALGLCLFLMGVTVFCIYKDANDLAGTALAGLMTIAGTYLLSDGFRKSS